MIALVTGSQGFLGRYVVEAFLEAGYSVIGVDSFSKRGRVSRPHDANPRFRLLEMDAAELSPVTLPPRIDVFVAGAARIGGIGYFHREVFDLYAENERLTLAALRLGIALHGDGRIGRFVLVSSSMVFERTTEFPTPEESIERCPPPRSSYGFQKLAAEVATRAAGEQAGLPWTIVRPFNCVGSGEASGEDGVDHVLPDFCRRAVGLHPGDAFPILGSGEQVRCFTHGSDIAHGLFLAATREAGLREDFNVSTPEPTSILELAELVWGYVHPHAELKLEHRPALRDDVLRRIPDTRKAESLLGFRAEKPIGHAVAESVEEAREHARAV